MPLTDAQRQRITQIALAAGIVLFAIAIYDTDFTPLLDAPSRTVAAVAAAIAVSGLWHLVRTWMWGACFRQPPRFARLARVRIAAEAVSYVTIRGVGGEPLKCLLLDGERTASETIAAVAVEKLAYLVGTGALAAIAAGYVASTVALSPAWVTTFRIVAVAAAMVALLAGAFAARRSRDDNTSRLRGIVGRLSLDAAQSGAALRTASMALIVGTIAAYAFMVAEVWIVLRIAGVRVTWTEAIAIETLSRIASFVTAFIPGGIGVLELSTVAAAAAVGATPGAAALAVARRFRGLFWAGVGLAWYPRQRIEARATKVEGAPDNDKTLLYIASTDALSRSSLASIAGLPIAERVVRAACRAGYTDIVLYGGGHVGAALSNLRSMPCRIRTITSSQALLTLLNRYGADQELTVVGEGVLPSVTLLEAARSLPAPSKQIIDVAAGPHWPHSGVVRTSVAAVREWKNLLRILTARRDDEVDWPSAQDVLEGRAHFVARVGRDRDLRAAEAGLLQTTYKSTDANVARFNRRLSLPISIALLRTPITANHVSIALVALGLCSAWLFSRGDYPSAVAAAALSLAASILDGCDGEIARLKYQESALGCWLETIGDYSYYVAILIGITIGTARQTGWSWIYVVGNAALFGTVLSFALLVYLRRAITEGQPDKLHAIGRQRFLAKHALWSRAVWSVSFLATRAAMPYVVFALTIVGALPLVVVLWAIGANIYWMSLAVRFRELVNDSRPAPLVSGRGPDQATAASEHARLLH